MIRHVYFLCFVLLLIACKSPYQKEICEALEQAGDNREELIKVLSYFKRKGQCNMVRRRVLSQLSRGL